MYESHVITIFQFKFTMRFVFHVMSWKINIHLGFVYSTNILLRPMFLHYLQCCAIYPNNGALRMSITITQNCSAAYIWLWVNKVRNFLDSLTGKLYGEYLAWYSKRDVGGSAKTLEIYKLYDECDVRFIELCRLWWAAHVPKMEETDSTK